MDKRTFEFREDFNTRLSQLREGFTLDLIPGLGNAFYLLWLLNKGFSG